MCALFLLLFDRMLALVFALQLGSQKVQQSRRVLSYAFDALDAIPQFRDLIGDRRALILVFFQHGRIGLVPDLIAYLAALGLQCGVLARLYCFISTTVVINTALSLMCGLWF